MMPPEKMAEIGAVMASAGEMAAREMTAEEWAERLVGQSRDAIATALRAAEARGRRRGQSDLRGAADHFEVAYRYATNAHRPDADRDDLLASAAMFAGIGYDELRKADDMGMPPADALEKIQDSLRERRVQIKYTNWRGEHGERVIIPRSIFFGSTAWHPEPQWVLEAHDMDKGATRYFALKDIAEWRVV